MESSAADAAHINSVAGLPQSHHGIAPQQRHALRNFADTALKSATGFWFLVFAVGQLMFLAYIVAFYGGAALQGNLAEWNKVLAAGHVPGDSIGNFALAMHLFLAATITFGGLLQLVPQIRTKVPAIHRWNGRIYLLTGLITSIAGLYMIWTRDGVVGDLVQHIGISLNAILIILCSAIALRYALARKFATHRRWALRLIMLMSGVWFFRVGLFSWLIVNQGPAGFDPKTFEGPFLSFLSFAQYLLPLAALELYLRVQDRGDASGRLVMAACLSILTVAMGIGIFGATMGLWLPRI